MKTENDLIKAAFPLNTFTEVLLWPLAELVGWLVMRDMRRRARSAQLQPRRRSNGN